MRVRVDSARLVGLGYYAAQALLSGLLAYRILGFAGRRFDVPLVYRSDALAGGSQIKATLETGWYETNPRLGAPYEQNLHDFPVADNLQFALAKVFGLFTDHWATVYNASYLVTFPLTAVAATWFLRVVGVGRAGAFFFGLLYAFTPYHFFHGQPHLALSILFVVPLFAALVYKVLDEQPIWRRRDDTRWFNPVGHLTGTTLGTLAIIALVGSSSSYYSVFGLILMTLAILVSAFRRRFALVGHGAVAMAVLIVVMLANMAPDILYQRSEGASPAAFGREPLESELYAFKLAGLVLPVPWHRIVSFAEFRSEYNATFPLPSESPALGAVAAVGFLFLLLLPLVVAVVRRRLDEDGPFGRAQRRLSMLAIVAFLCGTVGGFGTLFALFVSADIRAWNRIIVYLALFSLASVALLVDGGVRWLAARRGGLGAAPQRVLSVGVCGAVALVGLYDATPPRSWNADPAVLRAWDNDADYVARVEARMPAEASIFELPVMAFPESEPIHRMEDYQAIRPYLHSTDLRWSYGGVKGRPLADWQASLAGMSTPALVTALAAAEFTGLHVDRFGYSRKSFTQLEADLQRLLGAPLVSRNKRFQFYDLRDFAAAAEDAYGSRTWDELGEHLIEVPHFYWQPGFENPGRPDEKGRLRLIGSEPTPDGLIDNPGDARTMRFSFRVGAVGVEPPTSTTITWPDGSEQVVGVDAEGTEVEREVVVPPGQSRLRLTGAPGALSVNLFDFAMVDPVVADLELRGPSAELAGSSGRADRSGRRAG
ncbi:hypothetical protein ACJ5H2_15335 [Nocardioides sp. R1-1]|uniref:hypothetical protein n=1 Tax=Nocardioides sp. R1-1 TaxID=3383502 RepID=UPI0038CFE500